MTFINAKIQAEKADAIKEANEAVKLADTIKLADRIAETVRAEVERKIDNAVAKGNRSTGIFILGARMLSYSYEDLVAEAYKKEVGHEAKYGLAKKLKGSDYLSIRLAKCVHEKWTLAATKLLVDLDEAGYEVEIRDSNPHRVVEKNLELTAKNLVENYMIISW